MFVNDYKKLILKKMNQKILIIIVLLLNLSEGLFAQNQNNTSSDTVSVEEISRAEKFNRKAELLFKFIPVPLFSYSTETGSVFGLAKYNLAKWDKTDTITTPSSFSELISISTEGQFKLVLGSAVYLFKNKVIFEGGMQYVEYPEWILGVGNDIKKEDAERIKTKRLAFDNEFLYGIDKRNTLYIGLIQEYKNYLSVEKDTLSFLDENNYAGKDGGVSSGFGLSATYDTRDNKYNAMEGFYLHSFFMSNDGFIGSDYNYNTFEFEVRKYFNPWFRHVIAMQALTRANYGTTPFFSLSQIGGTNRMRAYYLGVIRDKVLADAQVEYRMPVWKIFGLTAFGSAGRVADNYADMSIDGLWYGGGFGLRIMVDSENKANLRIDFGYGQKGAKSVIIGFTEAF